MSMGGDGCRENNMHYPRMYGRDLCGKIRGYWCLRISHLSIIICKHKKRLEFLSRNCFYA